jgi:hypothetical protein
MSASTDAATNLLTYVAQDMRREIAKGKKPWAERKLQRGLWITLQNVNDHWRLALARTEYQPPSLDEIAICRRAFSVPEPVEFETVTKPHPTTKRDMPVVQMTWREICQPTDPINLAMTTPTAAEPTTTRFRTAALTSAVTSTATETVLQPA